MNQLADNECNGRVVLVIGGDAVAQAITNEFRDKGAAVAAVPEASELTGLAGISAKVQEIVGQYGKIDILVHAWESFVAAPAIDMDLKLWKSVVQANVKSKFLFAKEVGKHMLERRHGNIIMLSSIAGLVAAPGAVAFAASQGALHQITRTLGVEWANRGIRVNAVASTLPEGLIRAERIAQVTPMGRLPRAEELVGTVLHLASDASNMVTGQIVSVDGGYITQ